MKNSIKVIGIALLSFSNVVLGSGLIKKPSLIIAQNAQKVSYANANLLQTEIGDLKNYSQTVSDLVKSDQKITENEVAISTNVFVNYADENLFSEEIEGLTATSFVNFSDTTLFAVELASLKASKTTIDETIEINLSITAAEVSTTKTQIKKSNSKKTTFKKTLQY